MADWRDGLTPLTDWREGLKGIAPVNPKGPLPEEPSLMGSASNVIGTGTAGAQLGGAIGGPFGAAAGGVLGGAAGLMLPPSETPLTDLGATAGDLVSSFLLRGAPGSRMARAAKDVLATGLGAAVGATGDKALGFQKQTPWGNVTIYSALATPGAIIGSLGAKTTPIAALAEKHGIPLSVSEQTGILPGLEKMLTQGGGAAKSLGLQQSAAAQSALAKILNAPVEDSLGVVLNQGLEGQKGARDAFKGWNIAWDKANTQYVTKKVPSGVGWKTVTEKIKAPVPRKEDFEKAFGLTPEEGWGFRQFVNANPDAVVESLVPRGENQVKGLLTLRAAMTVLDKGGYKAEAGNLGQAMVMRYLREPFTPGEPVNGREVAKRIEFALGSPSEPGHLVTALGPERAEALREIAEVLKTANPLEKLAESGVSQGKRAGSYLSNKLAFTATSMGAVATAGGAMAPMGSIILGSIGGATIGIGLPTLFGKLMADPGVAKLLVRAAKGDTQAGARFIRTLMSSSESKFDREEAEKSRLQGIFIKQ